MEKTKLGIPVYVLGAVFYLLCMFGGYIPAILIAGYILIRETNEDIRTAAVTGLAVLLAFSVLNIIFGFFPDVVGAVQSVIYLEVLEGVQSTLRGIQDFINWLGDVLLVVLAVFMFVKKPLSLGFLKKIAN